MPIHDIVIPYTPRPQFLPYHARAERFAKIVAHRRFGKTVGCINDEIRAALSNPRRDPPPRYAYVAPTFTQAKDIAWAYILALVGSILQLIDSAADALGDPAIKDNITAAIGDAKTVGRILLGIAIVNIIARLRSIRKST